MKDSKLKQWMLGVLSLVVTALGLWRWMAGGETKYTPQPAARQEVSTASATHSNPGNTLPLEAAAVADTGSAAVSSIEHALQSLRASSDASTNNSALRALASRFLEMDRAAAVAAILLFLEGGQDALTGLTFSVQPDGSLSGAPTLRVALLDLLGALDRAAAARYADVIFHRSNLPDEWAMALRDKGKFLGRQTAAASLDYVGQVEALLSRREWLDSPTAGFLHAFDAVVFVGGERLTARLVNVHDSEPNTQTSFAARLALDRLALADYRTTVAVVRRDKQSLAGDPVARALIMSRANPLEESHLRVVHDYLTDPAVGNREKERFLMDFPNANLQLSNNLMTTNPVLFMANISACDRAALHQMQQWSAEGELASLHTELLNRIAELKNFLNQH